MRAFDTPLPIDAVLDDLTASLRGAAERGARGAARRRQDDAGAAGAARRALGRRRQAHRAGAAPARGPRCGRRAWRRRSARPSARRSGLRVRLGSKISRRTRIEVVTEGVFARMILDDPVARRHRRRSLRRVPRALPRCGSRPRARARCAGRPARGSAPPRHVGDPRRRAGRQAARRGARHRIRRPGLSGRDPLSRARPQPPHRRAGRGCGHARPAGRDRLRPRLPAGAGGDPPGRRPSARAHRRSRHRPRAALRRPGARRAGSGGQPGEARAAQGGARHLHRRDLAHHRGRARRHRFRVSPACRSSSRISA